MSRGRFGKFGGQYVPETLMNELIRLEEQYNFYKNDPAFNAELTKLLNEYAGRPSRLYYAEKMTKDLGGAKIYLKREDLNHTGAHKINNCIGQVLLAKKMGKTRVIAETGAGQHGVATATVAALLGMECEVFMGKLDCERQRLRGSMFTAWSCWARRCIRWRAERRCSKTRSMRLCANGPAEWMTRITCSAQ